MKVRETSLKFQIWIGMGTQSKGAYELFACFPLAPVLLMWCIHNSASTHFLPTPDEVFEGKQQ